MNALRLIHRHKLVSRDNNINMKAHLPSTISIACILLRGIKIAAASNNDNGGNYDEDAPIISTKNKIRGSYYGALVADALCLGSHYEYDAPKIKQAYNGNTIDYYMAPGEMMGGQTHGVGWGARNYHPGTVKGDQTDYGEYNVLVLEHLAKSVDNAHAFDVAEFVPTWQHRLTNGWKQWVCTQTKLTYQQIQQGTPIDIDNLGGNSNAMAIRYASVFAYYNTEEDVVDAARKTMFTHRERTAILGNDFFARVTYRIIHNKHITPKQAIQEVAKESDAWIQHKVKQALDKVQEASDSNNELSKEEFVDDLALTSMARLWEVGKSEPIKVGKASPTEGTLPGSIYFIVKYQESLIEASKANAMVGGDNASRAIAIGMVLGAYHGVDGIPNKFRIGLNQWNYSEALIETFPLLKVAATDDNQEL